MTCEDETWVVAWSFKRTPTCLLACMYILHVWHKDKTQLLCFLAWKMYHKELGVYTSLCSNMMVSTEKCNKDLSDRIKVEILSSVFHFHPLFSPCLSLFLSHEYNDALVCAYWGTFVDVNVYMWYAWNELWHMYNSSVPTNSYSSYAFICTDEALAFFRRQPAYSAVHYIHAITYGLFCNTFLPRNKAHIYWLLWLL